MFFSNVSLLNILLLVTQFSVGLNASSETPAALKIYWREENLLDVVYVDATNDSILLTPTANDDEDDDVEKCLFSGTFTGDDSASAVVVGCIDSDETIVSLTCKRIFGGAIDVSIKDGISRVLKADSSNKDKGIEVENTGNDYNWNPWSRGPQRFTGNLPKTATLKTRVMYDNSLLNKFGGDSWKVKSYLRKVFELTKPKFLTLDIKINLKRVGRIEHIDDNISTRDLEKLDRKGYDSLTSIFCATSGNSGIAYVEKACDTTGSALNIVSREDPNEHDVSAASRLFAHELGHNIGMDHDDEGHNRCHDGHLMESRIHWDAAVWSECSNSEFEEYYRAKGHACM